MSLSPAILARAADEVRTPQLELDFLRELDDEAAAIAGLAFDPDSAFVQISHVLDDRKPETRTAGVAITPLVEAKEALKDRAVVFERDARTRVGKL